MHEVATLLKMYFRELPDPVVPTTQYHAMLEASTKAPPEFVETVKLCVAQFPTINFTCLRLLFAFLYRVSLCSTDNKMTTENLGIVFAPNLLRAPNATDMNVMDLQVGGYNKKVFFREGAGITYFRCYWLVKLLDSLLF